jgi:adenylate kinase family enzyme
VRRSQLQRTVIVGNSGSGKSTLAEQIGQFLEAPVIDLDHIHWQGDTYGLRQDENVARRLVAEAAAKQAWVIEGVYGWLARIALPRTIALIWLDLPWEDCRAGLLARGPRRRMTSGEQAELIAWAADYWTRDSASSYRGHLRLFEGFNGLTLRFTSHLCIEQFVSTLAVE